MPDSSDRSPGFSVVTIGVFALAYVLMLVYGTLYPFHGWEEPAGGFFRHFLETQVSNASSTDRIANLLLYIPAGLLLAGFLARRVSWPGAVILAGMIGTALSFSLEAAQVFLPNRMSSLSDLLLNAFGTVIGGGAALILSGQTWWGSQLRHFRSNTFVPGALANIGLIVLALWILSQLSPLVPSLSVSNLRDGLKPVWQTATGQSPFIVSQSLVYFCNVAALGGIILSLSRSRKVGGVLFGLVVIAVLLLKIPVLSRQISLEALLGCAAALIALMLLQRIPIWWLITLAGFFLFTGYVVEVLRASAGSPQVIAFNWIPFRGHMHNQLLVGLTNILASGWVFLGAGYLVRYLCRPSMSVVVGGIGTLLVAGLAMLMEILQLGIPGRYPDVTDVLIAVVAWGCAWVGKRRNVDYSGDAA